MACGVPCLAHPACGASEVIRDQENGILERMETSHEVANVLGALLEDSRQLHTLGVSARQCASSEFSLESMIGGYTELYQEVGG
jgi:glycosyltransferase involved in cell wall biosynthesis